MQTSQAFSRLGQRPSRQVLLVALLLVVAASAGCGGPKRDLAPLTGKVTYQGEPLRFGSVMIEHEFGQPATAAIQPDGTFTVVTRGEGRGTAVGKRRVRVACYEGQDPNRQAGTGDEDALGRSLIPEKYTSFETSGLTVDVQPGSNEPLILELD